MLEKAAVGPEKQQLQVFVSFQPNQELCLPHQDVGTTYYMQKGSTSTTNKVWKYDKAQQRTEHKN
jgi:hypothetical protein